MNLESLPPELEAWKAEPFARVVDASGMSIRIETCGGRLGEIPEGRPAEGFQAMTWRVRAEPVPEPAPSRPDPVDPHARRECVLEEIEQMGSGTNRELHERLGLGLAVIERTTTELHAAGCLERKKCHPTGGTPPWRYRATGRPVPAPVTSPAELVRRRYRKQLLALLERQPRVTVSDASRALDCSAMRARTHIQRLFDEGLVTKVEGVTPFTFVALIEQRLAS